MVRVRIRFEGVREIEGKLNRLGAKAGGKLMIQALLAAAEPVRATTERRAPRKTGFLAMEFASEVDKRNEPGTVMMGLKKAFTQYPGFYGLFFEFGTPTMAARPFLRPSYDATKQAAMEAARVVLATGLGAK